MEDNALEDKELVSAEEEYVKEFLGLMTVQAKMEAPMKEGVDEEVADEEAIAKAEAKYNTEKTRIENKEQTIDLKMKNLDTEISSLTTEYDTTKGIISKAIEKGFKRYEA